VDLQSTLGKGTTVRVKIPLTLAIIPALVATCAGERLCHSASEPARTSPAGSGLRPHRHRRMVHGVPCLPPARTIVCHWVYLNLELQLTKGLIPGDSDNAVNIVVLQADDRQVRAGGR